MRPTHTLLNRLKQRPASNSSSSPSTFVAVASTQRDANSIWPPPANAHARPITVHETSGTGGPISPNEPYMHRQLMGLPTLGLTGPPMLANSVLRSNLTPSGGPTLSAPTTPLGHLLEPARINTPTPKAATNHDHEPADTDTLTQPTSPNYVQLLSLNYWQQSVHDTGPQCSASSQSACNLQGLCINGVCRCFAGFSGPTCARG